MSAPFGSSRVICLAAPTSSRQRSRSCSGSPVLTIALAFVAEDREERGSSSVRQAARSASTAAFGSANRCSVAGAGAGGRRWPAQPARREQRQEERTRERVGVKVAIGCVHRQRPFSGGRRGSHRSRRRRTATTEAAEAAVAGFARTPSTAAHAAERVIAEARSPPPKPRSHRRRSPPSRRRPSRRRSRDHRCAEAPAAQAALAPPSDPPFVDPPPRRATGRCRGTGCRCRAAVREPLAGSAPAYSLPEAPPALYWLAR